MGTGARRGVFLDRDGVIVDAILRNGRAYAALDLDHFKITDGAAEAVKRLAEAGFAIVVVTNQPEIARGTLSLATLNAMHASLRAAMPIDEIVFCPHLDEDGCTCRKPKPGMLCGAAARLGIDLASSFMVGDLWRDVEAGHAAGCRTILIERPYSKCETADARVSTVSEAANIIFGR